MRAGESSESPSVSEEIKLRALVTIMPQKYFLDRIGGNLVRTDVLVGEGQDPHEYQIKPSQMTALGQADFYLTVGAGFEQAFLPSVQRALPDLEIIDGSQGMELIPFAAAEAEAPPEHGEHSHGIWDPHIWLGTRQMLVFCETVRDKLVSLLPEYQPVFDENYRKLLADISALDEQIRGLLDIHRGAFFFVFHQAYGYFAQNYGLRQVVVEAGGKEPSARQVERLIAQARQAGVTVIFIQPQFSQTSAKIIAEAIGGTVTAIDPLVYDWRENMLYMAKTIAQGLSGE